MSVRVEVKLTRPELLEKYPGIDWLPKYGSEGAAGCDFRSTLDVELFPKQQIIIPSGLAFAIPSGFFLLIGPRSGLAIKHGIMVVNAPGVIDSDYRGEVQLAMVNRGWAPFKINVGDRIAQGVLQVYAQMAFEPVRELGATVRGEGGLGSTGGFTPALVAPTLEPAGA